MSGGRDIAPKKKRCLRRQATPAEDDESYFPGWLIYQNSKREQAAVPIGPPCMVSGLNALLIGSSVQWLKKIAFNHASHSRPDIDAILTLVLTLTKMAKMEDLVQRGIPDVNPASTAERSSAIVSESEGDDDGISDSVPPRDGAEVAVRDTVVRKPKPRKIAPGSWVALDLSQFDLGTITIATSAHAYLVYIQLNIADVRTVVSLARFFARELASRPPNQGLCTLDAQRIVWSHPRHAFKVLVCRPPLLWRRYKIFNVERRDRAGILYDDDAAILENSRVLRAARKYWNEADKSFEIRYHEQYLEPPDAD